MMRKNDNRGSDVEKDSVEDSKALEADGNCAETFVPDTSAIIDGRVREMVEAGKISHLIIPGFVISELENQANHGRETGFVGLEELKEIRTLSREGNSIGLKKGSLKISDLGRRPTAEEIKLAGSGRIDALIRDIAREAKATLITADMVQAKAAEAEGVSVLYMKREEEKKFRLKEFFDGETMSVHLKDGVAPRAKKGKPGEFRLVKLEGMKPQEAGPGAENEKDAQTSSETNPALMTRDSLEEIAKEIMELQRDSETSFVEIGKHGATVIQLGEYRITITRPPFSERMEITAVRPITNLRLEEYEMSEKLKARLDTSSRVEGIIVAGSPGNGKSTFAQALANHYSGQGKVVKTMENPRDMKVVPEVTQYGPLEGDMEKTADILLLVRPDITVYDELRSTRDFRVFSDLRLAGIGMIGVVHATEPIDAIHRFAGRVELGLIPQVVNTIIFIEKGKVSQVSSLKLVVKVPTGMNDEDLSRPVIEIRDFESGKLEYEMYTYGDETVILPVKGGAKRGMWDLGRESGENGTENEEGERKSRVQKLAEAQVRNAIQRHVPGAQIEIMSGDKVRILVPPQEVPFIIGRGGSRIRALEEKLGVKLDVEPIVSTLNREVEHSVSEAGAYIYVNVCPKYLGKRADIHKDGDLVLSAIVGKKGRIKVRRKSAQAESIMQAAVMKTLSVTVQEEE